MIARIEARVDEGKAVIFSNLSRHQFSHRARCGMKIGARNRLTDGIVDGKEGASPARLLRNRHCGTCSPKQSLSFGIWPVTSFVPPEGTPGTQQNCLRGTISGKTDGQRPRQAWKVLRRWGISINRQSAA